MTPGTSTALAEPSLAEPASLAEPSASWFSRRCSVGSRRYSLGRGRRFSLSTPGRYISTGTIAAIGSLGGGRRCSLMGGRRFSLVGGRRFSLVGAGRRTVSTVLHDFHGGEALSHMEKVEEEGPLGTCVAVMREGVVIGEQSFLNQGICKATVRTSDFCELMMLHRQSLEVVFVTDPVRALDTAPCDLVRLWNRFPVLLSTAAGWILVLAGAEEGRQRRHRRVGRQVPERASAPTRKGVDRKPRDPAPHDSTPRGPTPQDPARGGHGGSGGGRQSSRPQGSGDGCQSGRPQRNGDGRSSGRPQRNGDGRSSVRR